MSELSRYSSFPPAGPPCWRMGNAPVWRGGDVASGNWWHDEAVFALDFFNARAMRGGEALPLASALSTLRSSAHLLADSSGVYHSFAANMLATLPGRGAYIGGQVTPLVVRNSNLMVGWVNSSGGITASDAGGTALGIFARTLLLNGDATMTRLRRIALPGAVTSGATYTVIAYYQAGTTGKILLSIENLATGYLSRVAGPVNAPAAIQSDAGAVSNVATVLLPDGATYCTTFQWVPNFSDVPRVGMGPYSSSSGGGGVIALGMDIQPGSVASPWIVSEGSSSAPSSRLASDVRAASMGWFQEAGLATGFSFLAEVDLSHLTNGTHRHLFNVGSSSGNRCICYLDGPSGHLMMSTRVSGETPFTLDASAPSLGIATIGGRFVNGSFYLKQKGKTGVSGSASDAMPSGSLSLYLGQSSAVSNHFNDLIRKFEITRPLSNDQIDTWVAA